MILNFQKKFEKKSFFGSKLPETDDKQKKHMLPFSPDVKMIPAYLFSVSKAFLKESPVILILIPEV